MANPGVILLEPGRLVTLGPDQLVTLAPQAGQQACCDCAATTTLYAQACPCGSVWNGQESPSDCRTPDTTQPGGACLFVDLRSLLSDQPATPLGLRLFGFWSGSQYTGPTIKVGEHCYRFTPPTVLYAPPESTPAQRASALSLLTPTGSLDPAAVIDLPAGAQTVGGDHQAVQVVPGCGEDSGCAPVPLAGHYYELVGCDGIRSLRAFICARLALRGTTTDCRCVSHRRVYTSDELANLALHEPIIIHEAEPPWDLYWAYGPNHPSRMPAPSCCFCLSAATGSTSTCLSGRRWWNVWGARRWATTDLCCGRADGFRYRLVLGYTRRIVRPLDNGGTITTTIVVSGTRVVRRSENVFVAEGTITNTITRSDTGQVFTEVSPLEVTFPPSCCLYPSFDHRIVPTIGYLTQDGTTYPDDWDGSLQPWSQDEPFPPDGGIATGRAHQLRTAWMLTPWATALQLASTADGGTYSGTGAVGGECSFGTFRLTESVTKPDGTTDSVQINFKLEAIYDNSSPCGYLGRCGQTGWVSRDITELVP